MSNDAFGLLAAAGVPNSNQVIATGFNFSFEAGKVSGFTNIGRLVLIPAGVLFIYFMTLGKEMRTCDDQFLAGSQGEVSPLRVRVSPSCGP